MTRMTRSLPTGLSRWFFRAPIFLYRWRLGWLLGGRFLLLHHTGRRSGLPREAVVEVLRHDPAGDSYLIASGFGERSHWFRNVMARPEVEIEVGRRRLAARAERLSLEDAAAELARYGRAHPRAARVLGRYLGLEWDGSEGQAEAVAAEIPIIALKTT